MGRIFKYLVYLVVLAVLALIAYAYVGPLLGVDFQPDQQEIRQRIILDAD